MAIIFGWQPGAVHLLPSLPVWIAFLALVRWHGKIGKKDRACIHRLDFYQGEANRQSDAWFQSPENASLTSNPVNSALRSSELDFREGPGELQIEKDLLLTGPYSLFGFLNRSRLSHGKSTLYRWMLEALQGPNPATLERRQSRMQALSRLTVVQGRWYSHSAAGLSGNHRSSYGESSLNSLPPSHRSKETGRELFDPTEGRYPGDDRRYPAQPDADRAVESGAQSGASDGRKLHTVPGWLAATAGALALFSLGAFFSHEILQTRAFHFLSFPLLWIFFGIYLLLFRNKESRLRFDRVLSDLDEALPLLRELSGFRFHSPHLADEQNTTRGLKTQLRGAIFQDSFYSLFRNPLAFALGGLILGGPILADWSMGRFLARNESIIREWLQKFSELDALFSLACHFRYSRPATLPEIEDSDSPIIQATNLHHPLLAEESVGNDVDFKAKNRLWIITGSNMGGKSTFLRTLGMNLVLAQMGGAVRADAFRFRSTPLVTSMQIQDNLSRSESLFFAEVRSLKSLVDRRSPVFYFLDEMLKGTNQKDRTYACKRILSHLIESGATGLLTTHDMELTSLQQDYGEKVELYHFREAPGEGLHFDFKLHPGSVEGTTAIAILRNEGLPV